MIDAYYAGRGLDRAGRSRARTTRRARLGPICPSAARARLRVVAITAPPAARTVTLTIDGRSSRVPEGTTIYDAAQERRHRHPGALPRRALRPGRRLPHVRGRRGRPRLRRGLRAPVRGRHGGQDRRRPRSSTRRATLTAAADGRPAAHRRGPEGDDHRRQRAARARPPLRRRARGRRSRSAAAAASDLSNPVIAVNHDACILCDRCVRACDDIQGNDVIGRSGKGYATRIAFDLNDPMGESSCVTCGECVAACPTGALTNKPIHDVPIRPRAELDSRRHASAPTAASAARSPTTSTASATRSRSPRGASSRARSAGCA